MTYLLDTNACIAILNDQDSAVARKLATVPQSDVALCQIVKAELYFGAYKSRRTRENLRLLRTFQRQFSSLPFDDRAVKIYGRIRQDLERLGQLIGPNDLIIAAVTISHGAVLVTNNTKEFGRVRDLRLEDWEP
ncbi:MAG: type II toxin-antitoxin system VapC family toxin [bacterium]|nr:type II toxin-antitoxin system VapC family toxin [bacterium]